jgi:hypothetical protein
VKYQIQRLLKVSVRKGPAQHVSPIEFVFTDPRKKFVFMGTIETVQPSGRGAVIHHHHSAKVDFSISDTPCEISLSAPEIFSSVHFRHGIQNINPSCVS